MLEGCGFIRERPRETERDHVVKNFRVIYFLKLNWDWDGKISWSCLAIVSADSLLVIFQCDGAHVKVIVLSFR